MLSLWSHPPVRVFERVYTLPVTILFLLVTAAVGSYSLCLLVIEETKLGDAIVHHGFVKNVSITDYATYPPMEYVCLIPIVSALFSREFAIKRHEDLLWTLRREKSEEDGDFRQRGLRRVRESGQFRRPQSSVHNTLNHHLSRGGISRVLNVYEESPAPKLFLGDTHVSALSAFHVLFGNLSSSFGVLRHFLSFGQGVLHYPCLLPNCGQLGLHLFYNPIQIGRA